MFSYIIFGGLLSYLSSKGIKNGSIKPSSFFYKPASLLSNAYDYCHVKMQPFLLEAKRSFDDAYEQANRKKNASSNPSRLTYKEALDIFGFSAQSRPSDDEVRAKFKELMLQFHPDRGGSKFFAAQIIEAKKILMSK